jgi:hypothetical protein
MADISEFELSVSVSRLSDDSIKLCDIKMNCEALPPRPAFVARSSGVFNGRKDENPATEPEGEANILARKTRELLRL